MKEITRLLNSLEQGDADNASKLLSLIYQELREMAARKLMHEKPGQTLQPTALVHEAYLRLLGDGPAPQEQRWNSRGHFFAAAAEAMRRILVENARRKRRLRHGGERRRIPLDEEVDLAASPTDDLVLAVDEALQTLAQEQPEVAEVVKLRYFAGLTIRDTAAALEISVRTANRHWAYARAWLHQRLG